MTDHPFGPTPRERYLEHRQRTQSLTFSLTAVVMSVLVIVSLLVLAGVVRLPFGEDFATSVDYAEVGDSPCPSATSASAMDPSLITVQVLNASSQQGIAGTATSMLTEAGFQTLPAGNADTEIVSAVEIDAGPWAVDAAYSVARFFPDSSVVLTESTGMTVTVVLGSFYRGALTAEEAQSAAASPAMSGGVECLPIDPDMFTRLSTQSGQSGQSGQSVQSGE